MKRIIIALLMAVGLIGVSAGVAAAVDGEHAARACVAYDGTGEIRRKETCVRVRWDRQPQDGTGVVLEREEVSTPDGCSWLGVDGPKYYDTFAAFQNEGGVHYGASPWTWGGEDSCTWDKNFSSVYGADDGAMIFRTNMCAGDDRLWWRWRLYPGGASDLIDKGHEEVAGCNGGGGGGVN